MRKSDKQNNLLRLIAIFGIVFTAIGIFNNLTLGTDQQCFSESLLWPLIQRFEYTVPLIHAISIVIGLLFIIFPEQVWILNTLLIIESAHLTITGFQGIAIFIYTIAVLIFFTMGYFKEYFIRKALIVGLIWIILLSTIIPRTNGVFEFLFALGLTAFVCCGYYVSYQLLKDKLGFLIGDIKVPGQDSNVPLPRKGEKLILKEIGLTDRQIACVHYTIDSDWGYKQIAGELITSESTVKKEMQELYRLFGVKNREMLRLLLIQYKVV